ncbi:protection of telomeres protein 1a-like isoform X2 [Tasmannia lanceolata]|uniref:protection of telomeres protein 1a-like isoform X2 n=1 Tax=Tasmannia lanceolata TaxID=3420 RepID=UPI004062AE3B
MGRRSEYVYLELRDAICCIGQKVNLAGVITEFGVPRKSKGTDYFCSMKIMDTSYHAPGLSVNIFAENMQKLPHVKSTGDVIYLHRVVMKSIEGNVYAAFEKRFSSFALFELESSGMGEPYQISSNFHSTVHDKKLITQLRTCLVDHQFDTGANQLFVLLREIKVGQPLDLICKIICVWEFPEDRWMLFVWDGTDTPPISLPMKPDEVENPIPLLLEPLPLPRDVLCTFPRVGTVLRVIIDKELGPKVQGSGQWVKLRNITCEVRSGLWRGIFSPSSQLRFLSNEDKAVISLERFYMERLSSQVDRMPLWSFPWPSRITDTGCELRFSTLMDVLTHSKIQVCSSRGSCISLPGRDVPIYRDTYVSDQIDTGGPHC